jgi:catechol 2,3-dioxygenase-like lactoylglutathione lyase family enzyme
MTVFRSLTVLVATVASVLAADLQRPPITGIAEIAFRVSDLGAARNFYGHVLGYEEAFSFAPTRTEGPPDVTYFKVNDRQYITISPGLEDQSRDRLMHIGFETPDAQRMREYLLSRGVEVTSEAAKDYCGNLTFAAKDPDGHEVLFVQYLPDSLQIRNAGNFLAHTRLSSHILHVGIQVTNQVLDDHFYLDILGFRRMWAGGPPGNGGAWISYLVPDGSDWLEYMTSSNRSPLRVAGMNHVCLEVTDIQKPYQTALARGYTPPDKPVIARDGRWLNNFYDPDGTRTELMIRKPVETPCCSKLNDPYLQD